MATITAAKAGDAAANSIVYAAGEAVLEQLAQTKDAVHNILHPPQEDNHDDGGESDSHDEGGEVVEHEEDKDDAHITGIPGVDPAKRLFRICQMARESRACSSLIPTQPVTQTPQASPPAPIIDPPQVTQGVPATNSSQDVPDPTQATQGTQGTQGTQDNDIVAVIVRWSSTAGFLGFDVDQVLAHVMRVLEASWEEFKALFHVTIDVQNSLMYQPSDPSPDPVAVLNKTGYERLLAELSRRKMMMRAMKANEALAAKEALAARKPWLRRRR